MPLFALPFETMLEAQMAFAAVVATKVAGASKVIAHRMESAKGGPGAPIQARTWYTMPVCIIDAQF